MKRGLIAFVSSSLLLVSCFVAQHQAQNPSRNKLEKEVQGNAIKRDVEYLNGPGQESITIEQVQAMSQTEVIPTITEDHKAYAVGISGDSAFKTKVWEGVIQSFGVYARPACLFKAHAGCGRGRIVHS